MVYALIASGSWLLVWGLIVNNTGGFWSGVIVKVLPTLLGVWCAFEVAKVFI